MCARFKITTWYISCQTILANSGIYSYSLCLHVCTYVCLYACLCAVYACIHMCMCVRVCVRACTCVCVCVCVHTYMYVQGCVCLCVCMCTLGKHHKLADVSFLCIYYNLDFNGIFMPCILLPLILHYMHYEFNNISWYVCVHTLYWLKSWNCCSDNGTATEEEQNKDREVENKESTDNLKQLCVSSNINQSMHILMQAYIATCRTSLFYSWHWYFMN